MEIKNVFGNWHRITDFLRLSLVLLPTDELSSHVVQEFIYLLAIPRVCR